jgi:hypothetical protein
MAVVTPACRALPHRPVSAGPDEVLTRHLRPRLVREKKEPAICWRRPKPPGVERRRARVRRQSLPRCRAPGRRKMRVVVVYDPSSPGRGAMRGFCECKSGVSRIFCGCRKCGEEDGGGGHERFHGPAGPGPGVGRPSARGAGAHPGDGGGPGPLGPGVPRDCLPQMPLPPLRLLRRRLPGLPPGGLRSHRLPPAGLLLAGLPPDGCDGRRGGSRRIRLMDTELGSAVPVRPFTGGRGTV